MTKKETYKILTMLEVAYDRFEVSGMPTKMELWHEMLSDLDYRLALTVVKKHISEEHFPPTIASIRKNVAEITNPGTQMTADQGWGEITKAIRKYGIYQEEEALASMSPLTARIAKNMNWKEICMSENQMADRAHFIKMFEANQNIAHQQAMLPDGLAKEIEQQKHQCEIDGPVNVFAGLFEGEKND